MRKAAGVALMLVMFKVETTSMARRKVSLVGRMILSVVGKVMLSILLTPILSLAIEPPPRCRVGSAPILRSGGWSCYPSDPWQPGSALKPSDCSTGTKLFNFGQISKCLPPAPLCSPGCVPFAGNDTISGWECIRLFPCPDGAITGFDQFHGEVCSPPGDELTACPSGSKWLGECCGGCVPKDQRTCQRLPGWQWKPSHWEPADPKDGIPGIWQPAQCVPAEPSCSAVRSSP